MTLRHSQPVGGESASYWSVDAYNNGSKVNLAHSFSATTADFQYGFVPVTQWTTDQLTPNGLAVPEPSTYALLAIGLGGVIAARRRKK